MRSCPLPNGTCVVKRGQITAIYRDRRTWTGWQRRFSISRSSSGRLMRRADGAEEYNWAYE